MDLNVSMFQISKQMLLTDKDNLNKYKIQFSDIY